MASPAHRKAVNELLTKHRHLTRADGRLDELGSWHIDVRTTLIPSCVLGHGELGEVGVCVIVGVFSLSFLCTIPV